MAETLKKILYVDDESINLVFFSMNLRKEYQVITTVSPREALKILAEDKDIAILVTDFRMQEMNGLELIREAKKVSPSVVGIIITGFLMEEIRTDDQAWDLVYQVIQKPWNKAHLLESLKKAVQER